MKANRKFLNERDDEGVSPVIAVILMVAITVVLAATVYVWVSGFGAQSSAPAKSLAINSAGSIDDDCNGDGSPGDRCKAYTVASASPGMKYEDMELHIEGTEYTFTPSACSTTAANDTWSACAGTNQRAASDVVTAGDKIHIRAGTLSGQKLNVIDPNSNSVMLTLTVS